MLRQPAGIRNLREYDEIEVRTNATGSSSPAKAFIATKTLECMANLIKDCHQDIRQQPSSFSRLTGPIGQGKVGMYDKLSTFNPPRKTCRPRKLRKKYVAKKVGQESADSFFSAYSKKGLHVSGLPCDKLSKDKLLEKGTLFGPEAIAVVAAYNLSSTPRSDTLTVKSQTPTKEVHSHFVRHAAPSKAEHLYFKGEPCPLQQKTKKEKFTRRNKPFNRLCQENHDEPFNKSLRQCFGKSHAEHNDDNAHWLAKWNIVEDSIRRNNHVPTPRYNFTVTSQRKISHGCFEADASLRKSNSGCLECNTAPRKPVPGSFENASIQSEIQNQRNSEKSKRITPNARVTTAGAGYNSENFNKTSTNSWMKNTEKVGPRPKSRAIAIKTKPRRLPVFHTKIRPKTRKRKQTPVNKHSPTESLLEKQFFENRIRGPKIEGYNSKTEIYTNSEDSLISCETSEMTIPRNIIRTVVLPFPKPKYMHNV